MSCASISAPARFAVLAGLALACAQAAPNRETDSFSFHCDRGENALAYGRLDNADFFLTRAHQLAAVAGRGSPEQARVNLALAKLHRLQANPRKARHYLGLARFATRTAHGPNSLGMANVEMEHARQQRAAGLRDQAVTAVEEAVRIRKALLPANDPLLQETQGELAWAYHLAFQYPRAVETYRTNLETMERQAGASTRDRIIVLNRLAWIHERAALPERAAEFNSRAREIVAEETPGGGTSARLLALGLEELAPAGSRRETMEELKAQGLVWIDDHHYHPEHFDFERDLLVTLRRLDREVPLRKVRRGLTRDLRAEFIDFAPVRLRSPSRHRYGLPFDPGRPRRAVRTSEGAHGYERIYVHAVDFELPAGSPVVAARSGRVVRVVRSFDPASERGGRPEDDLRHGIHVNRVIVLHGDDTYATYLPLDGRIEVEEGDRVARGQRLGRTATLADGGTPIVHFDVRRNGVAVGSGGLLTPEPVRAHFTDVPHHDGVPLVGHVYSARPVPAAPARAAD
jgi:murein DD-endopeptidase MepM/ murein hydrolase activator NlpD